MAWDDFSTYSRKQIPGSQFVIIDSPFPQWNYRVFKYPGTFISYEDMLSYKEWCGDNFEAGSWSAHIGQIFASMGEIDGFDSIFFKNREDAVQFVLVWS